MSVGSGGPEKASRVASKAVAVPGASACGAVIAFVWLMQLTVPDPPPGLLAWSMSVSLAFGVALTRFIQMRVNHDEDGLRVVNFFWSRRVAWDDVERFEIDRGDYSLSIHGFVVRRDGSRVPCTALQTRWAQSVERARRKGSAAREVARLNRMLAARRGESLPPWPLPWRVSSPVTAALLWGGPGLSALALGVAPLAPAAAEGWLSLLLFAGLAVFAAGLWRIRVRVRVDAVGLVLAGWLRSRRVPWSDLEGLEIGRAPWLLARRVVVVCRDGVRVPVSALTVWPGLRRTVGRKVAELSEVLDDRRRLAEGLPGSVAPAEHPSNT